MLEKVSIAAIILTYNEEKHIARCIRSLKNVCDEIWVIDSYSTDRTVAIAKSLGANVVAHEFENQAKQFNWAIDNCHIDAEWIWRVDADEYVSWVLGEKVKKVIVRCDSNVNGIYVNKRIVFQGKALLHGGWYPAPQIKIIRKGFGRSENKIMDEHLIITCGKTIYVDADQTDENLNDLSWWISKHNGYASREALNMLYIQYKITSDNAEVKPDILGNDSERKRKFKMLYARMPLFIRSGIYFFIRYILLGGFLDGKPGLIWHCLQGFWYRFLVDAKIYEYKKRFDFNDEQIKESLNKTLDIIK